MRRPDVWAWRRTRLLFLLVMAASIALLLASPWTGGQHSAWAWPSLYKDCTGCHSASEPLSRINVAINRVPSSGLIVRPGDTFEVDWTFSNMAGQGKVGVEIVLPNNQWQLSSGTANAPSLQSWNTVWDQTDGVGWKTNSPYGVTSNGRNGVGYTVDYTKSRWDSADGYAAALDDGSSRGKTKDLDGVANLMGTDARVTVPGSAAPGVYNVWVSGVGHNVALAKARITQSITVTVQSPPTPTPTPSSTPTTTATSFPTSTPSSTATAVITDTAVASPTAPASSPTGTAVSTSVPSPTSTLAPTVTRTPGSTATATISPTVTSTITATATTTDTPSPTATSTDTPTATSTPSSTSTWTSTATPTWTPTPTRTSTSTPSPTNTATSTVTSTSTLTPTLTLTPTMISTSTMTPPVTITATYTATSTSSVTPTATTVITSTPGVTTSPVPSITASATPTPTRTATASATTTSTTTPSATPAPHRAVSLTSGMPARYISVGGTITYTLTLTNDGDAPDSFTISETDTDVQNFSTSLSMTSVNQLGSHATIVVNAVVAATGNAPLGAANTTTVRVAGTGSGGPTATQVLTTSVTSAAFDRQLSGDRVGQHKAPPQMPVLMQLSVTASTAVTGVVLKDSFPNIWTVTNPAGGIVAAVGNMTEITWNVGNLAPGQTASVSYQVFSPSLTSPPTSYDFLASIVASGTTILDSPWSVTVSDAPLGPGATPTAYTLHSAPTTVNGVTFNTVNTSGTVGTRATSTASGINANGVYTFADGSGHAIFASSAVPNNTIWDLSSSWTFNIRVSANATNGTGYMRARLYRISSTGVATLVATTTDSTTNVLSSTSTQTRTWSYTVGAFRLNAGERFGVDFQVNVTNRGSVTSATMAYDISSDNSTLSIPLSTVATREAHYRIGQDSPLNNMLWYAATDTPYTNLARATNFRVRFQLYNNSGATNAWTPQLEFGTSQSGPWTVVPTNGGADPGTAPFFVATTAQYGDAAAISTGYFGLGAGTGTPQTGIAYETANPAVASFSLGGSNYTEVEFNVRANNQAAYATPYFFRLTDRGTDLMSYGNYAQVTLPIPPVAKEAHFGIGEDTALTSPQLIGGVDSSWTRLTRGTNFRVRFQIYNDSVTGKSLAPQMEYATSTGGPWTGVPTNMGADPGTAPFFVAATSQFTDGAAILTSNFVLGGAPAGAPTAQQGYAYSTSNPAGATFALNGSSYTEIEFSIQANSLELDGTQYFFRLTNSGTLLDAYANYAQVTSPVSPAHGDSGGYSATTDACAKCHRGTHDSTIARLTYSKSGTNLQEQACYTCHDGTGAPAPNIQPQFAKTYVHPIAANDLHKPGESTGSQFSGANRHVECADCHDPHYAAKGNHTPGSSNAARVLTGVFGVAVTNGTNWTAPSFSTVKPLAAEYQLCLKCHSSWAYGSTPPTSHAGGITETDQAVEFNVNNYSYHWVEGDQTATAPGFTGSVVTPRTNDGRNMTLLAPWSKTSQMTCTDCHASDSDADPRGAHGSTQPYLLRGAWTTNTGKTGTSNDVCFKCHDWNIYGQGGSNSSASATGFSDGSRNLHRFHMGESQIAGCQSCHSAVPHGSKNKALLEPRRIAGVDQPTTSYNQNGALIINSWGTSGSWNQSNCAIWPGGGH